MPTASISAAHSAGHQPLGEARPFGADKRRDHGERQHQLHIVVVDMPGAKMPMKCSAAAPMTTARAALPSRRRRPCRSDQQEHRRRQQQQRPGDQRDGFAGRHAAGDRRDGKHDRGDRRIDQPRPVHDEAAFRPHAVLMQVEPALAADQVANLDQAQQAVIVAAGGVERRKAARRRGRQGRTTARRERQQRLGAEHGAARSALRATVQRRWPRSAPRDRAGR